MRSTRSETLEERQRQRFWEKTNSAFESLRKDPNAWQEEIEERDLWEKTLADGLHQG